jgi:hypothetical protein
MMSRSLAFVSIAITTCAWAAVFPENARAAVLLTDVIAKDAQCNTYAATAAFGLFDGNDTGNQGTALPFLNGGGPGLQFADIEWTYAGKSETGELNPFTTANSDATSGTLTFKEAYSGTFAISLKAGDNHAIYVFEDLSNIISIEFTTQAFAIGKGQSKGKHKDEAKSKDLSHASFFVGESPLPSVEPAPVTTPEPTSLAIFALGGATLALSQFRRRRAA